MPAPAQVAFTGSYSQDFNSLATTGTADTWANNLTLAGWFLYTGGGTAITTYAAGTGSSSTGSFYSFGAASSTDRAFGGVGSGGTYFGSPASGAVGGYMAVALTNTTSDAFSSITISFDGEQWRNGGNTSAQTMVLQYGFGTTFSSVSSWIEPDGTFNWTSPVTGSTAAAVDGTTAGQVPDVGGTLSVDFEPGDTLWFRWVELNDPGNDHGLAIDNLSITTPSETPEPSSIALAMAGGLFGMMVICRRQAARSK